jgi:hypothetical protein
MAASGSINRAVCWKPSGGRRGDYRYQLYTVKTGVRGLIEFYKPPVFVIRTFDGCTVTNQGIEEHCCVHKVIIRAAPAPDIGQGCGLRGGGNPVMHPDTGAKPAVRAVAVNRYITIGTGNGNPLFLFIALEGQGLHTKKYSAIRYDYTDMRFSPEKWSRQSKYFK